jgi:restriction system protein
MDLVSVFLKSILSNYWYFIPIVILIVFFKTSYFKGFIGEVIINIISSLFLDKNQYHLIKNVTLPTEDGTTQIDHIIVSKYGIFVVETKNMKGWIFGSEKQKMWTQIIYKHKGKFQNPLYQNYKHVKTIQYNLGIDLTKIFSVVVFVGGATFKTKMPGNITYPKGYLNFIKSKKEILLSDDEIQEAIRLIELRKLKQSYQTHKNHVKHVKRVVMAKQINKTCPKCGSSMILRTAQKGANAGSQFWGCSKFPKCRGTLKVSK